MASSNRKHRFHSHFRHAHEFRVGKRTGIGIFFVDKTLTNKYFSITKKHFADTNSKHMGPVLLQTGLVRRGSIV